MFEVLIAIDIVCREWLNRQVADEPARNSGRRNNLPNKLGMDSAVSIIQNPTKRSLAVQDVCLYLKENCLKNYVIQVSVSKWRVLVPYPFEKRLHVVVHFTATKPNIFSTETQTIEPNSPWWTFSRAQVQNVFNNTIRYIGFFYQIYCTDSSILAIW